MYYVMLFTVRAGDGGGGGRDTETTTREREGDRYKERRRQRCCPLSALTAEPIATFSEASPAAWYFSVNSHPRVNFSRKTWVCSFSTYHNNERVCYVIHVSRVNMKCALRLLNTDLAAWKLLVRQVVGTDGDGGGAVERIGQQTIFGNPGDCTR